MKAIDISKKGKIEYKEVKEPKIKKGYVKVKVKAVGLCGSDIQKLFFDKKALNSVKANIWGHEISGIVYEVGKDVKNFKKGDKVVINPLIRDKLDDPITMVKSIGKDFQGGFAEYVLIPYQNLRKISQTTEFEEAVLVDSIAVALHGYHLSGSPINKKILIIGDGSLALITSFLCLEFNNKVTMVGKNLRNLKLASSSGIIALKDKHVKNLNKKYNVVFEVVGRNQDNTINQAVRFIRPNCPIVVLGVFKKDYYGKIFLRELFYKEGKIIGSNSYGFFNGKDEFDMAINLLKKIKSRFSRIVTNVMPLKDFKRGLGLIKTKKKSKAIKIVFKP